MGALICFSESLGQAPANEATPQVEGMDGSDSLRTISKQVDEVRVFFTVTDSRGRFVSALSQKDFHLLDDGRPPERLYQFQGHTALPLQIVMLVDISIRTESSGDAAEQYCSTRCRSCLDHYIW